MLVCVRIIMVFVAFATTHAFVDEAVDVIKLGIEIGEEVLSSWEVISKPLNVSGGVELPFIKRRERQVLSRLAQVRRAISKLELDIEKNGAVAMIVARSIGRGTRLELKLHEMGDLLSRIDSADRNLRVYLKTANLEKSTLQDFAEWCVSHDSGALPDLLERVYAMIAPPHKHLLGRGILQMIADDLQV
ncbi:unnamed protein product [Euphydryas editha]|uniref:Uncharacterized protein n=1 Tax=Euphydryas editha TaxID=104508 RepID=A0AAU9U9Q0_EUPED|nr:unnamed protein product [Euphydryas editha]